MRPLLFTALLATALAGAGCASITVRTPEPIKVHMVIDVNVNIQNALDERFRKIDERSTYLTVEPEAETPAAPARR